MKRSLITAALIGAATVSTLGAQPPAPRMGGPRGRMPGAVAMAPRAGRGALDDPAAFLLAQTGELKLTDAQVTRLAAIARRSADRRRALRARVDSMRPERALSGQRPDSATRDRMRQRFEQLRPDVERLRDQAQADRRDAIAVLTPDQQAMAWERVAATGQMRRNGFAPGGGRGFGPSRNGFRGQMPAGGRRRGVRLPNDDAGVAPTRPGQRRRPEDQ